MTDTDHTDSRGRGLAASALVALIAAAVALLLFVLPAEYGIDPTGVGAKLGLTSLAETGVPGDALTDVEANDATDTSESPAESRPDAPAEAPAEAATESGAPPAMILGEYPGIPDDFDYYEPDVLGEPYSKQQPQPYRTDTFEIKLEEFEQVEYKAILEQGDVIVYSWSVDDGVVYTDFHADPGEGAEGYPDQYFIRYRESESASDSGSLVAPFDGNHGWYWLNIEDHPITITLNVAGYYSEINELFRSFQ